MKTANDNATLLDWSNMLHLWKREYKKIQLPVYMTKILLTFVAMGIGAFALAFTLVMILSLYPHDRGLATLIGGAVIWMGSLYIYTFLYYIPKRKAIILRMMDADMAFGDEPTQKVSRLSFWLTPYLSGEKFVALDNHYEIKLCIELLMVSEYFPIKGGEDTFKKHMKILMNKIESCAITANCGTEDYIMEVILPLYQYLNMVASSQSEYEDLVQESKKLFEPFREKLQEWYKRATDTIATIKQLPIHLDLATA